MSYLQKRQHLSAVALGRKMFAGVAGMTPARFDLLHVLYQNMRHCPLGWQDRMMPQGKIAPRLGLTRQTVSKMIRRLIELDWIDQYSCSADARRMLVGLTDVGQAAIEKAYDAAFTERYPLPPKYAEQLAKETERKRTPRWVRRIALEQGLTDKMIAWTYENAARRGIIGRPTPGDWFGPLPEFPTKIGREVGRVFTNLAGERAVVPDRGRRLDALHTMLQEAYTLARALGDTSSLIYPVPRPLVPQKREYVEPWLQELTDDHRQRASTYAKANARAA